MTSHPDPIEMANRYRRHMERIEAHRRAQDTVAKDLIKRLYGAALDHDLFPRENTEEAHIATMQDLIRFLGAIGFPDLLDALRAMHAYHYRPDTQDLDVNDRIKEIDRMAKAAIARATGSTPS